jgi:hypothetical protein
MVWPRDDHVISRSRLGSDEFGDDGFPDFIHYGVAFHEEDRIGIEKDGRKRYQRSSCRLLHCLFRKRYVLPIPRCPSY